MSKTQPLAIWDEQANTWRVYTRDEIEFIARNTMPEPAVEFVVSRSERIFNRIVKGVIASVLIHQISRGLKEWAKE